MLLKNRKREGVSTEEELRSMVELLNEKAFGESGSSRLELQMHDRSDLDGVLAFIVLVQEEHVDIDQKTIVMHIPPITLCWGGGHTADLACQVVIEKFSAGSDILHRYLPFTAGSLDELKIKAVAYYG